MPSRHGTKPTPSASSVISPKAELLLDRQLVMHRGQKLTHEHVESAIAAALDSGGVAAWAD